MTLLLAGATVATIAVAGPAQQEPAGAALSATCPPAFAAPFPDVPADHPFCRQINTAKERGVVSGYPDGSFQPGSFVTRQAVAAMLWRAANADSGLPPEVCTEAPFTDVPVDHPFCPHIRDAALAEVFNGYPDGTFQPGAHITRQAVAAVLVRFPGGPVPTVECAAAPFVDVPVGHTFCPHIRDLADAGATDGYADGTFQPVAPVTRQAFVAMLIRWIEHFPDVPV